MEIHGTNGPLGISGDNFPLEIDPLVLNASSELGGQFAFNPDVNRGDMIGISASPPPYACVIQYMN